MKKNDYDAVSERISTAVSTIVSNTHDPFNCRMTTEGDSITITKNGLISALVELGRLRSWVDGLAESHRTKTLCHHGNPQDGTCFDCHVEDSAGPAKTCHHGNPQDGTCNECDIEGDMLYDSMREKL